MEVSNGNQTNQFDFFLFQMVIGGNKSIPRRAKAKNYFNYQMSILLWSYVLHYNLFLTGFPFFYYVYHLKSITILFSLGFQQNIHEGNERNSLSYWVHFFKYLSLCYYNRDCVNNIFYFIDPCMNVDLKLIACADNSV